MADDKKIGKAKIEKAKSIPRTGDGKTSGNKPKGVVFRNAQGQAIAPPKAGKASRLRLPRWLGGK